MKIKDTSTPEISESSPLAEFDLLNDAKEDSPNNSFNNVLSDEEEDYLELGDAHEGMDDIGGKSISIAHWLVDTLKATKSYCIGPGDRLGANGLHQHIQRSLKSRDDLEECKIDNEFDTANLEGELDVLTFQVNGKIILIFPPASDMETVEFGNLGTRPIADLVKRIQSSVFDQPEKYTVFIPLGESRNARQHWTLLVMQGGRWNFFDPKHKNPLVPSFIMTSYDLAPCMELVQSGLPADRIDSFHPKKKWLGIQSAVNDTHCGYYVEHIISQIITKCISTDDPVSISAVSIDPVSADALYRKYTGLMITDEDLYEKSIMEDHARIMEWNSKRDTYKDALQSKVEGYNFKNEKKTILKILLNLFKDNPEDTLLTPEMVCEEWHSKWKSLQHPNKNNNFSAMMDILNREESYLGRAVHFTRIHRSESSKLIANIFGENLINTKCSEKLESPSKGITPA